MTPVDLEQVRSIPLFSGLSDAQLTCLDGAEIIEVPAGTILASEGERTSLFHGIIEGEVRVTRIYDRQTILMGVAKSGGYLGETMLLLDIPWLATARVVQPARLLRLDADGF